MSSHGWLMAGSVLTLFLNNPMQSGGSAGLLDLNQPATSTSTTGWTIAKNSAGRFSRQTYDVKVNSGNFGGTAQNSGAPITTSGHIAEDCWRTSVATTGNFSAGTWYSSMSLISVSAAATGTANINYRIWRSTDPGGASPTEITASNMTGTSIAGFSTTVAHSSSASTHIGAFSLNNEFLFLQAACQITVASGSNSADAVVRMGAITDLANGSHLVTSVFSATGGAAGGTVGPGYWPRVQDWLLDT